MILIFINWIAPLKKESLESYALRLRNYIPEPRPLIIGISFGGMLVTEMAKADSNIKGIIISSNKTSSEFPKNPILSKTSKRDFLIPRLRRSHRERHQKRHDENSRCHQNHQGKIINIITAGIDFAKTVFYRPWRE